MEKVTKISFKERVRGIAKQKDSENFSVVFRTRAAFYWIQGNKANEIKLLEDSARNNSAVNITCNAITREILEVSASTEI